MTTENREAAAAALDDSTLLDSGLPIEHPLSDAALAAPKEEPKEEPKAPSTREVLTKHLDEAEAKDKEAREAAEKAAADAKAKAEEAKKPKDDAKAEKPEAKAEQARGEGGKFAKQDQPEEGDKGAADKPAAGQDGAEKPRQSEGRNHPEPPARFLPEARAKWANVPNEVKAEFHRVSQEMEAEIGKQREVSERYESIRQFDEIARANGRELKDSLARITQVEMALRQNPVAGLDMILREVGPRKPDGSPLSLFEIAGYVVQQGPQAFQQNVSQARVQPQPAQPQRNPEIDQLKAEIQSLRAEQTVVPVIQKFANEHQDFDTLAPKIKTILDKGIVDEIYGTGLSLEQKLAEAYRMAGGNVSPSRSEPIAAEPAHSPAVNDRPVDPAGQKSIRGAPNAGFDPSIRRPKNNRDAAAAALAGLGI